MSKHLNGGKNLQKKNELKRKPCRHNVFANEVPADPTKS